MKLPASTEYDAALLAWSGAVQTAHALLKEGMRVLGDGHGSDLSAHRTLLALRRLEHQLNSGLETPELGKAKACPRLD
jgi:hypothetical protein